MAPFRKKKKDTEIWGALSFLIGIDLTELINPVVFQTLEEEDQFQLMSKLSSVLHISNFEPSPPFTSLLEEELTSFEFKEALSEFQYKVYNGDYDPLIMSEQKRRVKKIFEKNQDSWKKANYEEYWGQRLGDMSYEEALLLPPVDQLLEKEADDISDDQGMIRIEETEYVNAGTKHDSEGELYVDSSQNSTVEQNNSGKKKRGRGRPRKEDSTRAATSSKNNTANKKTGAKHGVEGELSVDSSQSSTVDNSGKKKRGRGRPRKDDATGKDNNTAKRTSKESSDSDSPQLVSRTIGFAQPSKQEVDSSVKPALNSTEAERTPPPPSTPLSLVSSSPSWSSQILFMDCSERDEHAQSKLAVVGLGGVFRTGRTLGPKRTRPPLRPTPEMAGSQPFKQPRGSFAQGEQGPSLPAVASHARVGEPVPARPRTRGRPPGLKKPHR